LGDGNSTGNLGKKGKLPTQQPKYWGLSLIRCWFKLHAIFEWSADLRGGLSEKTRSNTIVWKREVLTSAVNESFGFSSFPAVVEKVKKNAEKGNSKEGKETAVFV